MRHVNASNWSPAIVVSRYAFILWCLVVSAAASIEAQQPKRPVEPVILIINADESLKKAVTDAILKEFRRLPGIEMKVLDVGQPMMDYRWSVTIVVDETTRKGGSKNGGYVMAAAYSNLIAVFDADRSLAAFAAYDCVPKSRLTPSILETRTGVSDLKSMVVWGGAIREGFAGPGSEIAAIFEREYLPEIQRQGLQPQIRR